MSSIDERVGFVVLRGKEWEIDNVTWCGAEPDVGIMGDYIDTFDLVDADGNKWDWDRDELTQAENELIDRALIKMTRDHDDD